MTNVFEILNKNVKNVKQRQLYSMNSYVLFHYVHPPVLNKGNNEITELRYRERTNI